MTESATEARTPLQGIRVLDIATFMAAPWSACYLGEFGADVIKIELPGVGDQMRKYGGNKNGSPVFWSSLARNKRAVTLDLKVAEGAAVLKRMVAQADVLVENFRPGTLERWGLGADVLMEINPRLVMLRITGYGQDGPYKSRPGFGSIMESFTGFAHITGHPGGPPTLPPVPLADGAAGIFGAYAVMIALYWRDQQGGSGQVIDLSLYEPLLRLEEPRLLDWEVMGVSTVRNGNRLTDGAPRNTFQCSEGDWITLSGSSQQTALRVFDAIGRPELKDDPKFATNKARLENNDELEAMIGAWTAARTRDEVLRIFGEHSVAAAAVYDIPAVFDDAHVKSRGTFVEVKDPNIGTYRVMGPIPRMSKTPGVIRSLGPEIGEHNDVVYREFGFSDTEVAELKRDGVI